MPQYQTPHAYIAAADTGIKSIEGVSTSTAAFIGLTRRGPSAHDRVAKALHSFGEFEQTFGGLADLKTSPKTNYVAHAAKAFFEEGGRKLFVARVRPAKPTAKVTIKDWQIALDRLAALKDISIVAAPGSTEQARLAKAIQDRLIAHAAASGAYRFAVLDIPKSKSRSEAAEYRRNIDSKHAAFYYPWVKVQNPSGHLDGQESTQFLTLPPSGFICGIYARSDLERGVYKAPANEVVRGAAGLECEHTQTDQEALNPEGVNCLRYFVGRGYRVWGARTATSDPEWKYVHVRRYITYLEQSIDRGTQWTVFEPNDEPLWATVRGAVSNFLLNEWKQGGLLGRKSEEAFFVRCDHTTMTQSDIDNGRLVCEVGVALIRRAEFLIFRVLRMTR